MPRSRLNEHPPRHGGAVQQVSISCGLTPGGRAALSGGLARCQSCSPATASSGDGVRDMWPLQML